MHSCPTGKFSPNFHGKAEMSDQGHQSGLQNTHIGHHFVKSFIFVSSQWVFDSHLWEGTKNWTLTMKQVLQNYDRIQRLVCSSNVTAENTFLWAGDRKVMQVKSVAHCHIFISTSWGTAQPPESAVWIKVLLKIRLVLQRSMLFPTRIEGPGKLHSTR